MNHQIDLHCDLLLGTISEGQVKPVILNTAKDLEKVVIIFLSGGNYI